MLKNVWLAFILTLIITLVWLRLIDFIAHKGWISSSLSRKIIHSGTGLIFVLCWLLFPEHPAARYLAALIPLAITTQFALVGLGIIKDQASVDAMSRTGQRKEILRGPLYYGIVIVILTLVFWKNTPTGIVAMMLLCGGDGLAEIIGSRAKSSRLPWSHKKSLAGTVGMLVGGWVFAFIVISIYVTAGAFPEPLSMYVLPVAVISVAATLVETLPFNDIDNLTVPAIAVIIGYFLF